MKLIRKKASSPPLGVLTVAGMLPADWKLLLIDMNISELSDEDLATVRGLAAEIDVALPFDETSDAFANDAVVVGHENDPSVPIEDWSQIVWRSELPKGFILDD